MALTINEDIADFNVSKNLKDYKALAISRKNMITKDLKSYCLLPNKSSWQLNLICIFIITENLCKKKKIQSMVK